MKAAEKGEPQEFSPPEEGIVSCYIDPATGLLSRDEAAGIKEYFKKGTEPKQFAPATSIWKIREDQINPNFD
jgi:membrane carboxypeptidase/penicillin-binding protein